MTKRWGVKRTDEGGVSIGYTSIAAFRRCPRRAYWSLLHGGTGIQLPPMPPSIPLLYGQLWHRAYASSWLGKSIKDSLLTHLSDEGLEAEAFHMLVDEVVQDITWYWDQARGAEATLKVLLCEEELRVRIGPHELRGTPDLVAQTESGSLVLPDHKTFGVLSFTRTGGPRIELDPRENTIQSYQASRQFPYYCLDPRHRTLTLDLNWVEIGDLKEGHELLAFSEAPKKGEKARRLVSSTVEALRREKVNGIKLVFSDGSVIRCSEQTPFLTYPANKYPAPGWVSAKNLNIGNVLPRYFFPWETLHSEERGYLAAAFNGEGYLSNASNGIFHLDKFRAHTARLGFLKYDHIPTRSIIKKHAESFEIVRMQTSSGTYFGEGFGVHNCSLWNKMHPEQPCYDAMLNLVPSHVTQVLGILGSRAGNVKLPQVKRLHLEPYSQAYLDEVLAQALALCDHIAEWWAKGSRLEDALVMFPEVESQCVGYGGQCAYLDLCRDPELRETLINEVFQVRE